MGLQLFALRRQPIRAFYLFSEILVTLLFRLPYWMVKYARRSRRPRVSWSCMQCIMVEVVRLFIVFGPVASRLVNHIALSFFTAHVARRVGSVTSWPDHRAIPKNKGTKGIWIDPAPELIVGEIKKLAEAGNVQPIRLPGAQGDGSSRCDSRGGTARAR